MNMTSSGYYCCRLETSIKINPVLFELSLPVNEMNTVISPSLFVLIMDIATEGGFFSYDGVFSLSAIWDKEVWI